MRCPLDERVELEKECPDVERLFPDPPIGLGIGPPPFELELQKFALDITDSFLHLRILVLVHEHLSCPQILNSQI